MPDVLEFRIFPIICVGTIWLSPITQLSRNNLRRWFGGLNSPSGDKAREIAVLTWVAKITATAVTLILVLSGSSFGQTPPAANAQSGQFKRAQFNGELPAVDIPVPEAEAIIGAPAGGVAEGVIPDGIVPSEVSMPGTPSEQMLNLDVPAEQPIEYPSTDIPQPTLESPVDVGMDGGFVESPQPNEFVNMPEETFTGQDFIQEQAQRSHDDGSVFGEAPAPVYSTGSWLWRGQWYTDFSFISWTRFADDESADSIPLASEFLNAQTVDSSLRSTGEQFDFEPGIQLKIGYFMGRDIVNRDHNVEFQFTGFLEWEAARSISGDENITTNAFINEQAFFGNSRQAFVYDATFNSFELNYSMRTRPGRDQMALGPDGNWTRHMSSGQLHALVGGLRYISIGEKFLYSSFTDDVDNDGSVREGEYNTKTGNSLFGAHVGVDFFDTYDKWFWTVKTRVGGFANTADRTSFLNTRVTSPSTAELVTGSRDQTLEENAFSFLAEAGLSISKQLRPNASFRVGYDILYVTGIATAPENAFASNPVVPNGQNGFNNGALSAFPVLTTDEHALFHGANIGFELFW